MSFLICLTKLMVVIVMLFMIIKQRKAYYCSIPEYDAKFYSNRRNFYIHMGLDKSLFSFENYQKLLNEIDRFLNEHLEKRFIPIFPPKLIYSTKWKHDYIVCRKY